jgi:hypothetical protein
VSGLSDRFATWDAAYVLGALSPVERREYEEHLPDCSSCQSAVSELAGIPGLLAQVPPEDAVLLAAAPSVEALDDGPPPDLLARVRARPSRRRRRASALVGVAAALVLILAGIGYAVGLLGPNEPKKVAFEAVRPTGMTAVVDVTPVADGTNIEVQCVYGESNEPHPGGGYGRANYTIYVVDRAGNATQVKDWPVQPNRTMRPKGHTSL